MEIVAFAVLWTFSWISEGITEISSQMPEELASASGFQRRNDPIDEAFHQHKDVLLEMLEAKLKELREQKKKKRDNDSGRCGVGTGVELHLNARGLTVVGNADANIRINSDNSSLALEASGVAAVGRARVTLSGPRAPHVPGLGLLFSGDHSGGDCVTQNKVTENIVTNKPPIASKEIESGNNTNITKVKTSSSKPAQKRVSHSEGTAAFKTSTSDNYYSE